MAIQSDLDLAIRAAKAAGDALAARNGDFVGVNSADGRDIKLKADEAAEALILGILKEGSDYPVLAEEGGWDGDPAETFWVVDPLDGSSNYNRRIPLCAVSIALVTGRTPVLGVIHDFNMGETYAGGKGLGATLNGAPMQVSDVARTQDATLMTGFPVRRDFSPEALAETATDYARWKKVRMVGTAAIAAAYVAAGRADRYAEDSSMLWDIAAGCALVEAAGGRVVLSDGPIDGPLNVLCDNGKLAD